MPRLATDGAGTWVAVGHDNAYGPLVNVYDIVVSLGHRGDGFRDAGEACDPGSATSAACAGDASCSAECTCARRLVARLASAGGRRWPALLTKTDGRLRAIAHLLERARRRGTVQPPCLDTLSSRLSTARARMQGLRTGGWPPALQLRRQAATRARQRAVWSGRVAASVFAVGSGSVGGRQPRGGPLGLFGRRRP